MVSITVSTRPARRRWVWIGLGVLTIVSFLPAAPQGPFDARDGARIPGVHLEMPLTAVLLEPLAAPVHVLAGAPDFRRAGIATLVWVGLGAAGVSLARDRRRNRWKPRGLLRAAEGGLGAVGFLVAWLGFGVIVRLPGWRLVCDDPTWAVADLQTHTYGSRDGLVSAPANLATHAGHGYDVVAVTEHKHPDGAFAALRASRSRAGSAPDVIPGVEVRSPLGPYLLGIGLRPGVGLPKRNGRRDPTFERRFLSAVHQNHRGAVIALSYRLSPADVDRLAALGVDAFEIVNLGHPALGPEVRDALLRVAGTQGIPLVASSDWHGWGGVFRTWTLVRCPGGPPPEKRSEAERALDLLRHHQRDAFVPAVAGVLGRPGWARVVTAPFFETVRYLLELSPVRVLAWWAWGGALSSLLTFLARRRARPGRCLLGLALWVFAIGLGYRGVQWVAEAGASPFSTKVGLEMIGLALACAAAGAASTRGGLRAPRKTRETFPAARAGRPAPDLLAPVAEDARASG
ncbi:MAG: hypothetical protein GXP50_08235 [Deltaproteobacteria bacterium]|nr:hypothetical protein [Deltaproteobacteria bacterium]